MVAASVESTAFADEGESTSSESGVDGHGVYTLSAPGERTGDVILAAERVLPMFTLTDYEGSNNDTKSLFAGPFGPPPSAHAAPRLGIDVAIAPGILLGGAVLAAYDDRTKIAMLGAAPRLSVALRSSARVSFFLRGGIAYAHTWQSGVVVDQLAVDLEAPMVLTVVEHAAVTLGPTVSFPLAGRQGLSDGTDLRALHFGLYLGLLAWL